MALVKRSSAASTSDDDELWENISLLPKELKDIVGRYSPVVQYEKMFLRHQFFRRWSIENVDRLIRVVRMWTKSQISWFIGKCRLFEFFDTVMKKEDLIAALNQRLTTSCRVHPGSNGVRTWCPTHARKVWQYFKVIEIVHNVFEQRKRLRKELMKREREQGGGEKEEKFVKY
jgi:hypothetical protein